MSCSHMTHPARTVEMPSPTITFVTFRPLTAADTRGPALGPTSAADGPMNPTNKKAEPTHNTPETMCRNLNTIMKGTAANIIAPLLATNGDRPASQVLRRTLHVGC